jgi:uncharacterized protein (TIGR00369 family)
MMSQTLAVTASELQEILSGTKFTQGYGFQFHSIADGECTLHVPFQEAFERPGGVVSGQVYMAAADVAMWLAIKTKRGKDDPSVTVAMQTTFIRSARREDLRCTAKLLKMGRRLTHGVAECVTLEGKLLSHHTITYMRPEAAGAE